MTISGTRPEREPPRLWEVWEALKTRLETPTMNNILMGAGRVYGPSDTQPEQEDVREKAWGRTVIVPTTAAWNTIEEIGRHKLASFLVRVDLHRPLGSKMNVQRWLESAHAEAFRQLHGYGPISGMQYALVEHPIHREVPPEPVPLWDEERGLWYMSAVYHVYVSPKPLEV